MLIRGMLGESAECVSNMASGAGVGARDSGIHSYAGARVVLRKVDLQTWHWMSLAASFWIRCQSICIYPTPLATRRVGTYDFQLRLRVASLRGLQVALPLLSGLVSVAATHLERFRMVLSVENVVWIQELRCIGLLGEWSECNVIVWEVKRKKKLSLARPGHCWQQRG